MSKEFIRIWISCDRSPVNKSIEEEMTDGVRLGVYMVICHSINCLCGG